MKLEIQDGWDAKIKEQWKASKESIQQGLIAEYGVVNADNKINNFIKLDENPISIIAFHNKFLRQIRSAYVIGSYYPALTGACALGERILNHLIIRLRNHYKSTKEFKIFIEKTLLIIGTLQLILLRFGGFFYLM